MAVTQTSSKLGSTLPGTTHPDMTNAAGVEALLVAGINAVENALFSVTEYTAAGAIAIGFTDVALKAGSAAAMTLAAPSAAQNGTEIMIFAEDAFAYTVTTPASKINGASHILTWTAAIGNWCRLKAFGTVWYLVGASGVALT